MKLDILVFAAHPDDAELSMGGTIAKLSDAGLKVGIIDLTQGEMSTRGNPKLRREEAKKASSILKITNRENLSLSDGDISLSQGNLKKVVSAIRKYKPKIIFAPYFNDRHPDHIDTSNLIKRAMFSVGLKKFRTVFNDKIQQQYRPAKIFYYMQTYLFNPSFIIDVSDHFLQKMEAVKTFQSQFHNPSIKDEDTFISKPDFLEYVEVRAKFYGFQIGKRYGEPFYCEEQIEFDLINYVKN